MTLALRSIQNIPIYLYIYTCTYIECKNLSIWTAECNEIANFIRLIILHKNVN